MLELIDKYYVSGAVAALAREILYWRDVVHRSNDIRCGIIFMSLLHVVLGGALAGLVCQEKQFQSIPYALGVGCFWNEFLKFTSGIWVIISRAQELFESQFVDAVVKSGGDVATSAGNERIAVFTFGVVFIVALLVLAIAFPIPTAFQYTVFRIVLALAASGVAAFVPGFIEVDVRNWVRAGGAIAVFVIIYFFSPAGLVTQTTGSPVPTDLFTIHMLESTDQGTQAHRFTFPYSDISKKASYVDFASILQQLPGSKYSTEDYTVFRIRDEVILRANSQDTAVSGNNTGVLIIPNVIIRKFESDHLAFTYLWDQVRQGALPNE